MNHNAPRGLSIVRRPIKKPIEQHDFTQQSIQGTLFPVIKRNLAIVVNFPDVTGEELSATLRQVRPTIVLDARAVPTFSLGQLNRRSVFGILQEFGSTYVDYGTELHQEQNEEIHRRLTKLLFDDWREQRGPFVFLTHRSDAATSRIILEVLRDLAERSRVNWDLYEVPHFE